MTSEIGRQLAERRWGNRGRGVDHALDLLASVRPFSILIKSSGCVRWLRVSVLAGGKRGSREYRWFRRVDPVAHESCFVASS
jgi:hypothetical protein